MSSYVRCIDHWGAAATGGTAQIQQGTKGNTLRYSLVVLSPCIDPRWFMYGIFAYIWVIYGVNVGKYSIHGWSGDGSVPVGNTKDGNTTYYQVFWSIFIDLPFNPNNGNCFSFRIYRCVFHDDLHLLLWFSSHVLAVLGSIEQIPREICMESQHYGHHHRCCDDCYPGALQSCGKIFIIPFSYIVKGSQFIHGG